MYARLERREDEELATVFGEEFLEWAARTPAVLPWGRTGVDWKLRERTRAAGSAADAAPPRARTQP
jgi:hypothetical protein